MHVKELFHLLFYVVSIQHTNIGCTFGFQKGWSSIWQAETSQDKLLSMEGIANYLTI
jgi:hypothetical protein